MPRANGADIQVALKLSPPEVKKLDSRAARNLRDRSHELRAIVQAALREENP